ncbi:6627_t:CDS:2, partial [Dentiscutata heterogama]
GDDNNEESNKGDDKANIKGDNESSKKGNDEADKEENKEDNDKADNKDDKEDDESRNKGNKEGNKKDNDEDGNKGNKDKEESDKKDDKGDKGDENIVTKTSKRVNQLAIPTFLQEISLDIINYYVILASITKDIHFDKIEINPTKEIAILKNNQVKIVLEPINPLEIRKTINGRLALEYKNLILSNSDDNLSLQDQIMLLKCLPEVLQDLRVNNLSKNESSDKKIIIFTTLISTCYQSIFDCNITTYNIEVSHRILLRFLTKCATQVRALVTGKESLYNMFNINQSNNSFNIKYIIDGDSFIVRKRKKNQDLESFSDLNINIPGFVENILSRKLTTFITAGPRLHQLLKALNNN